MSAPTLPANETEAVERSRLADKRLATVRAELALQAITVHVADDGYLACRWGLCKALPCIEALEQFAVRVGARRA